ncbi:MAG: hypothetical protein CSB15_01185 [Clostridiales bacterium]|nr:MAG: hypothetical protein CSB15_01185 [Clostridiales bacterium]
MKKNFYVIFILTISLLMFSSCSSNSAKSVGKEFMNALKNNDVVKLKEMTPKKFHILIDDFSSEMNLVKKKKDFKFTYSNVRLREKNGLAEFTAETLIKYVDKKVLKSKDKEDFKEEKKEFKNKVKLYLKKNNKQWEIINVE